MFHHIFGLLALAVAGWIGVTFFMQFRSATGSTWDRVLAAAKGSATIAWQKVGIVTGALVAAVPTVADWIASMIGDPSAADAIKGYMTAALNPKVVGASLVAFAFVGVWARMRTLPKA